MVYTGLVRTKCTCHFGGVLRKPGEVFEVAEHFLWSDDPLEPVEHCGEVEEVIVGPPPQCTRIVLQYRRVHFHPTPAHLRTASGENTRPEVK